jgi:hypothetical protein
MIRTDPDPDRVLDQAPAVQVDRVAPDLVALGAPPPVVRVVPHPVGKVELTVVRVVPHPVGKVELTHPVGLHLVNRAALGPVTRRGLALVVPEVRGELTDPAVRVVPVELDPVGLLAPVDLVVRLDLTVVRVDLDRADPVELGLLVPVNLDGAVRVGLKDREDRAVPDLMAPVVPVAPVDHLRRLMCSMAPSIGVARNSAVRGTRRTASAHPITVLRHRRGSAGSVGTTGRLPGVLRRTGTGRRPPVAGTVRRLLVAGTRDGTVRAAT